jgi:hypothetical protein
MAVGDTYNEAPDYVHRQAVARLRELASGAEPDDPIDGICWDLTANTNHPGISMVDYCMGVFIGLGFEDDDVAYPLGEHRDAIEAHGDLWSGEEGERRRALAARMARFIAQDKL